MRALYLPSYNFVANQLVNVEGDAFHHLQVVRVKKEEELLLLNGIGAGALGRIVEIQKRHATIQVNTVETRRPQHPFSLAIGVPKKDAFEDILKMATELGVRDVYPLTTEYSQYEYVPSERSQKILESALIQSNNFFMPTIHPQLHLEQFLKNFSGEILFLNSRQDFDAKEIVSQNDICVLIGPEGGFSREEEQKLISISNVKSIHFATPILRAPTAVASAIGYLLASSKIGIK